MMGLLVKDLCLLKEQRQTAILLVMWLLMIVFDRPFSEIRRSCWDF